MNNLIKNAGVVVPTLNAAQKIETLLGILTRAFVPSSVIVVDSESVDGTADIARKFGCRVISVRRDDFDHGSARNLGALALDEEFIFFLTDDAVPEGPETFHELLRPFADSSVAACYARQLPRRNAEPLEAFSRVFNYPDSPRLQSKEFISAFGIKAFFMSDSCSVYRRSLFDKMGRFPEPCLTNEDMYMAAKLILAGYAVRYTPEARVIHSHRLSFTAQFKRYFNLGVFFEQNAWILSEAPLASEGLRFLRSEFSYLLKNKHFLSLLRVGSDAVARYAGLKLGISHKRFPLSWAHRLSGYPAYLKIR